MTRSRSALPLSLLSLALLTTPLFTPSAHAAEPAEATSAPALGRALSTFAGQRGIALSFDPALTVGRRAPTMPSTASVEEGFAQLLAGTGLHAIRHADGSYTLARQAGARSSNTRMPALRVSGAQPSFLYAEGLQLDEEYLQSQSSGNGDIGSMLRINPAVQFDNAQLSSYTPGDITPADISINGAQFYQNSFLIDGMSFNPSGSACLMRARTRAIVSPRQSPSSSILASIS